jgi:NADPH:quinone reductase-like Zn-dependent oxidoreductase
MKAIIHEKFGGPEVLQLKEVEKPAPTETRGVLVKVYASSVNPADYYSMAAPGIMRLLVRGGIRKPKDPRLGTDIAGRVEAVSGNVTQFKPGDEVFGVAPGSYAEYATAKEDRLALKPANVSFEQAAASGIAAFTALQALRDHGLIKPGQKVLVNGAGGGVGTFAVQIAKALGAEVTAVTSTENMELVRSLGADHVIDYTKEDFTRNGLTYDLICDIAASHSISDYKRALNPNGRFVLVGIKDNVIRGLAYFTMRSKLSRGDKKFSFFIAKSNQKDLVILKELMESGKLRPVVDASYPLEETPAAMKHMKTGHARGKVTIRMD